MSSASAFVHVQTPEEYAWRVIRAGGTWPQMYLAPIADGELRVIVNQEHDDRGRLATHVSASVGRPGEPGPFRAPTPPEIELVRTKFAGLIGTAQVPGADRCVIHLWEVFYGD